MTNFCGIDFGTSNSTIGVMIDNKPTLLKIDHSQTTIPSAIFYDTEEHTTHFGRDALQCYQNHHDGRLLRSFKSILGTSVMADSTLIGSTKIKFTSVISDFIYHLKSTAEKNLGHKLDSVVLGRPIYFADNNNKQDQQAEEVLKQAALDAGFKQVKLQYEPIAAALKYEQSLTNEKLAMIIDIGGGTSDISIIKLSPELSKKSDRASDCLANTGVHIGGTDFDRNLSLKSIMPLLGYDQQLKNGRVMPSHPYFDIATWHRINNIYSPQFIRSITSMAKDLQNQNQAKRLEKLLYNQLAFQVALQVENSKIELSNKDAITTTLHFLEENLETTISQNQLHQAIHMQLESINNVIKQCITNANITKEDIDVIFLTGGSSKMTLLKNFVQHIFPNTLIDNQNSLSSVGIGLVLDANKNF